jgi:hypothetical protein
MAAFGHLAELRRTFGTEMPRRALEQGFQFENSRVSFVGPTGIWKPAVFPTMPLLARVLKALQPHLRRIARSRRTTTSSERAA